MARGVVFNDGQRVSDVRPEEPPPSRSPQKERFIIEGVQTRPAWTEALSIFFDIKTNVTKKVVERMLRDAGHFLGAKSRHFTTKSNLRSTTI